VVWSNHFCVSADKVPAMAGAYEREAIRAHVLGHFRDMPAAAEGHPAMLFYLDNARSIGPNSVAGINRDRGLNEKRPPAPKGFDDNSAAWTDGLAQRLDIANQLASRLAASAAPDAALEAALGPLASAQTRDAIARAATRPQALTLLFMAPEFQRR
jgi:uncharacterized protein (DUF1800 family)